jgi:hypothetical protein
MAVDRKFWEHHLAEAERHTAECEQHVARQQRAIAAELKRDGHDAAFARGSLAWLHRGSKDKLADCRPDSTVAAAPPPCTFPINLRQARTRA